MFRRNVHPDRRRFGARGFTLIETAIATVIIGVGVIALLQLLAAGTISNKEGAELTTAIHLAGNIHEAAVRMDYDDLFDLDQSYSPPVDARLMTISGMDGWSQVVDVSRVDVNLLTSKVADTQPEPTTRISVTINRHGQFVYRASWLAAASQ